jgi:hypothetical protein|tara:strand:+ start:207 stop:425 length:219 start_codon:yes stop_codon:yes gene_type:complete
MKKIFFISLFLILSCKDNDCGDIVDKYERDGKYFFTLIRGISNNNNSEGGGQAEVSRETYDSFNIGEEYCIG